MPINKQKMGDGVSVNMDRLPIACVGRECECDCSICHGGKHCRRIDCYIEEFHPYQETGFIAA